MKSKFLSKSWIQRDGRAVEEIFKNHPETTV